MAVETFLDGRVTLHCGDCLDVLTTLPENSVDAVCCDPPYHLTSIVKRFGAGGAAEAKHGTDGAYARQSRGFMGKQWDGGDIAFRVETWQAVLRVLKPGGYILAFASTRGFGRMSVAIEDAGFITHPLIAWVFGSGFPKATRIKAEGYEGQRYGGQALKPAIEPIYMGQKPFEKGLSGTENILKWRTGALNIDACRVPMSADDAATIANMGGFGKATYERQIGTSLDLSVNPMKCVDAAPHATGRWPANLLHDGSDEVLACFPDQQSGGTPAQRSADKFRNTCGEFKGGAVETGIGSSEGSAARFFYTSKADADDRLGSKHPTVKPLDLVAYLCRLITPARGTVLDLFAGTGTTGEAAWREGLSAILIEREPEYQADIRRRMELAVLPTKRAAVAKTKNALMGAEGTPLFGGAA